MEEKKIKKVKIVLLILFIINVGFLFIIFRQVPPVIEKNAIKKAAYIPYVSELNYRQTINDCGPYNTAAVVRALKDKEIDSGEFAREIGWRLPNKYTLPWGLEGQLKAQDIVVEKSHLWLLSNEAKILFLRQQLSQEKPVIILGQKNDSQHYITIFGFDALKDEFYIYDSLHDKNPRYAQLTVDDNGHLPGNKTISSKFLLDFWRGGGMYGVFKWYALVAHR